MSQGNDFANYGSSVEDRSSASEDVWFVAVSSDDIKQMSVDQLDEAFRLGVITAETAVWTEGMEAWAPLGEVADLDSDEDASGENEVVSPAVSSHAASSHAAAASSVVASPHGFSAESFSAEPFSADRSRADRFSADHFGADPVAHADSLPSTRRTNPGWHNPFDPPAGADALGGSPNRAHNGGSIGPSSFAPVTASYAPSAGASLGQSTGPVALNVDEDMPPVNRGRRVRPERWLLAAAGILAVGVVAFNNKDLFSAASSSVAAAEKQASAAALVAHPYELGADKSASAAAKAAAESPVAKGAESPAAKGAESPAAKAAARSTEDDKDAPIGSLKGEAGEEAASEAAAPAAPEPAAKPGSTVSKEALRGGFAKAFSKPAPAAKPTKAAKPAKAAKLARKAPSRAPASKSKKPGVARAASAFDPLNGSLP